MKNKINKILSVWLAAAAIITSVAIPTYAEGAVSNLSLLIATPSMAKHSTATPSIATPSTPNIVFDSVEPETIPKYYQSTNYRGKKFWKFVDRNGETQYRDYGFKQGNIEFPLWYEVNEKGIIGDSINPDTEYYNLAPFLYESQNPSKDSWKELSLMLVNDEEWEGNCSKESVKFENWDSDAYEIWHIDGKCIEEKSDNNIAFKGGYFFYGTILNHKEAERGWYYADEKGTVLDRVLNKPMNLATVTCKINSYFDAPGTYRHSKSVVTNVTENQYTLASLMDLASTHFVDEVVNSKINFTSNFVGWSTKRSTDNHITVNAVTGIEYIQGDPADTNKYFSYGTFYPPKYSLDVSNMSSISLYGIWCPKNADMYVFAGEPYKGEMSRNTNSYSIQAIVVRRGDSFDVSIVGKPSKSGYTFKGWYYGNMVEIPEDGSLYCGSSGKVTYVYPNFVSNTNTVTFKDADGTVLKTESVTLGGNATPPAEPTRPGYTFIGWDKELTNITSATIITAQYEANHYNLTIDGNGGLIEGSPIKKLTVDCNAAIDDVLASAQEKATLKYHTLDGWYTLPLDGDKYPESGNKMPAGDVTIFAHWSRSSSLVTYKDWNGNILKTDEVMIGGNATPPEDPVRPGYMFTGWDKDSVGIVDHTTITAQYCVNGYELTLDGNGGTIEGADKKVIPADYNSSLDQILLSTKESVALKYHTLEGWYTLADGGNKYLETGNKMPAENVTVYAHWIRSSSLVTYEDWDGEVLKIEEVPVGGNATPPADPNRPGYRFIGWDKESKNIQDHITITAQYATDSNDRNEPDDNLPSKEEDSDKNHSKKEDSEDSNTVYVPTDDSAAKPEIPDHGGDFTVNPDNPYDITYTKPDGSKGDNEWIGDGEDWFHINSESKVDYDWYLERQSWYMLNKGLNGKIGAAKYGWYFEPMDKKWYYFDSVNAAMKIGWQSIDNKWYYFTVVNNGQTYFGNNDKGWVYDVSRPWKPFGSMFKNEKTPDGYLVNESGAWSK